MGIRVIVEGMYAQFEPGMLNLFEVADEQPVMEMAVAAV